MIKQNGFTLLEVMVALAIMAVLSLLTTQAIRSGIANKALVSSEIDREARLIDALRILRSDIASAFHYRNIFCEMNNDLANPDSGTSAQGSAGTSAGVPGAESTPKPCPLNPTGFIGTANALYFTSLSNVRTLRDSQESDQAKIGYFVQSCRVPGQTGENSASQCLFRSSSPILDGELDKPGPATLLLDHVEEFKLRYLGPDHQDYVDTWRTGKDGDDSTREQFPYAVEITLTIHDKGNPKDRPATQTILAPLMFENNPKKKPTPNPEENQGGP